MGAGLSFPNTTFLLSSYCCLLGLVRSHTPLGKTGTRYLMEGFSLIQGRVSSRCCGSVAARWSGQGTSCMVVYVYHHVTISPGLPSDNAGVPLLAWAPASQSTCPLAHAWLTPKRSTFAWEGPAGHLTVGFLRLPPGKALSLQVEFALFLT